MNEDEALKEVLATIEGPHTVVVLIMPRNMGKHPDAPRGHSAVIARADVAAEWEDGKFHIFKSRDGRVVA